jgi:hypothetical protein
VLRFPLWRQLLILWTSAITLSLALIALDALLSGPYKFFWLIPYPNLRLLWAAVAGVFRAKPLLATGVLLVPTLAALATIALVGIRLARSPIGR